MDSAGRGDGRTVDHLLQRHTHRQALGHRIQHGMHMAVDIAHVQVGADRVWWEAVGDRRHGRSVPETGRPVPKVEVNALFARLAHIVVDLALFVDDRKLPGEDMRVYVARAQVFEQQVGIGALRRPRPKVDHDRHFAELTGLDGGVYRSPGRVFVVEGLGGPVVGGFDADADIVVGGGGFGGLLRVEVGDDLFGIAHARRGDIDETQDTGLGRLDHGFAKVLEFLGTGGAGVDAGGDAFFKEVRVGVEAAHEHAGVMRASVVGVYVDVEQAGRDDEVADVDDAVGLLRGDILFDAGYAAIENTDVADCINIVGGVDDVAAFEQDFEFAGHVISSMASGTSPILATR